MCWKETMAGVLGPMNKVIVDEGAAKGFVPYFPVPGVNGTRPPIPQVSSSAEATQPNVQEPSGENQ